MTQLVSPVQRLWSLVQEKKSDITAIYFFAILIGLIQLSFPLGIQTIIGLVLGGSFAVSLIVLIALLIVAVFMTGILQVHQMKVIERIQQRLFVKYSFAFADRIPKLDLKKVDGIYLPELVNRFFDTMTLQKGFAKILLDIPSAVIQILFGLTVLSFYHPFFIFFGVLLLLLLWLILHLTGKKGLESSLKESAYKYRLVGWLEEMARLVKTFKFSNSGLHLTKADEKTIQYLKARTHHFQILEFQYKVLIAFKVLITGAMLVGGVFLLVKQQINIGQFVAAEIIIIAMIASVESIIVNLASVYDIMTAAEKINKVMEKPVEHSGSYKLESAGIAVHAKDLCFEYEPDNKIIQNLNFSILPGEKVCITGSAGSGKSTLLHLISGIYKTYTGSLSINNVPLANYDLEALRERTGILFSQENIFHGTLWDNLTIGKENIDKQYLMFLCKETGLLSFLESLSNGFDTELDPTGKRLPKTIIQKILVVRCLIHQPDLIIAENPWSDLGSPVKESIQRLLLNSSATVIVGTNDESFIKSCNKIIQLEKKQ